MTSLRTRRRLVDRLRREGITDERVLKVVLEVPRHIFVDEALASRAYEDTALPIGHSQTLSQPYMVATMTEALLAHGSCRCILEIGTGSGYQTAILAKLVDQVYTVERLKPLMNGAINRIYELRLRNVHFRHADGISGWPEHAPYDGIMVTAAAARVPASLLAQLGENGKMVVPVGEGEVQELLLITRNGSDFSQQCLARVNFVPLLEGDG